MKASTAIVSALVGCSLFGSIARAQSTTIVSVDSLGAQGDADSAAASLSEDASQVAFASSATDLVRGDTNAVSDVFVRNRAIPVTTRVSVGPGGTEGNGHSIRPAISADGRFVAFESVASNLVAGDTNTASDVFIHDRVAGTTARVSIASSGGQANSASFDPAISADGRFIAFESFSTNLAALDTNLSPDIFVHDRLTGSTQRVSVDSGGAQADDFSFAPALSADGRYVAFESSASNLVTGDTNGTPDIFVHDRLTGSTSRVSVTSSGAQAAQGFSFSPSISADGAWVAFQSVAADLVAGDTNNFGDVFVHERASGTTTRVSVDSAGVQGNNNSSLPAISADGRFVAYQSLSTNLVPADTNANFDVFLHDLLTGVTSRASVNTFFGQGDGASTGPAISADGRFVAFESAATSLVSGDSNDSLDVFLHDAGPSQPLTMCFGDGSVGACPCGNGGLTGHGCENSSGTGGGILLPNGIASLASSTLELIAAREPATAPSVFLQGSAAIAPQAFGDGLRCTGGTLLRLYVKFASGGTARAPEAGDPSIPQRSAALGDTIPVGATRFYQTAYRDPDPTFCPIPAGNSWNVTQALAVVWSN